MLLQDIVRSEWKDAREKEEYAHLFKVKESENKEVEWDFDAERKWGQNALKLLSNYVQLEDPSRNMRPNPIDREMWLNIFLLPLLRMDQTL